MAPDAKTLTDRDAFREGPPHDLLDQLRQEAPADAGVSPDDSQMWAVCKHADIAAISKDPARFSSSEKGIFPHKDQVLPLEVNRNLLLFMDPPEHTQYRKILQTAFVPNTVAKRESWIREIVTEQIDNVIEEGSCDFVTDIAVPIPLRTLAGLMGVPDEDLPQLAGWIDGIERSQQAEEPATATELFVDMAGYLNEIIARQKEEGGESLVMRLVDAEIDGEKLSDQEILVFFGLLVFAGNDTTRNTMGHGMRLLIEHPEQMQLLRDDPERIPHAVEEILRYSSVVNYFCRTAREDTELSGRQVAKGDKVMIWYTAGSRDPGIADDPHRFDITREEISHMAFGGGGRHFCLGAGLARLELRVAFEEIAKRMHDVRISDEIEYLGSNWAHALTSLPIEFTPGERLGSASG